MFSASITVLLLRCVYTHVYSYNNPVRETRYGKIQGKITSRYIGVSVEEYLGVPYAAPPIGNLRFKRPQVPESWKGKILQTTKLPPACPTFDLNYIQHHKKGFNDSDEDCLFMNIYVPKIRSRKTLPVLLFIHGGSNADGMGAMVDGDLLAAHGKIIVITFNYRIATLGFYANPSQGIIGNNGLMDQVLAMKWVQQNVHYFDGNPNQVTLHGHSAGGGDVGLHLMSDLTKGLFKNVIIHSGSPLAFWMLSSCVRTMRTLKKPEECKDGFSILRGNATIAIQKLLSGYHIDEFFSSIENGEDMLRVVVDGQFLKDSPAKLLSCGQFNVNNVLLIMARDEGVIGNPELVEKFYSRKNLTIFIKEKTGLFPERKETFGDDVIQTVKQWKQQGLGKIPEYLHLSADVAMFGPMIKLADFIRKKSKDVYMLSFEYLTEKMNEPEWIGVQHGWDLFYAFGFPLVGHHAFPYTPRDAEVSKKTMTIISDFVKSGHLRFNHRRMKRYNSRYRTYNKLDYINGQTVVTKEKYFRKPRIEFWNKYLFAYDKFHCHRYSKW